MAIAILGIISATAISTLNPLTQIEKTKDVKREIDLSQLKDALESYYLDNFKYPSTISFGSKFGNNILTYLSKTPQDPSCSTGPCSTNYTYVSDSANPHWFIIFAKINTETSLIKPCPFICNKTKISGNIDLSGYNYCVYGGEIDPSFCSIWSGSPSVTPGLGVSSTPVPMLSPSPTLVPTSTPTQSPTQAPNPGNFSPKVLVIGFNPTEGNRDLASTYYSWLWGGRTAAQEEDFVFREAADNFRALSNNTINYQIVQKINVTQFPAYTNGFQYTIDNFANCDRGLINTKGLNCEQQKALFDETGWIRDNRICETADSLGVDEIWSISVPYIMTYESFMFGPTDSFWVNAPGIITPQCRKHYVVMSAAYNSAGNFLHIYGHRIESFMRYITATWQPADTQKYWDNFSAVSHYGDPNFTASKCGNAHLPANGSSQYDYANVTTKTFNCPDWKNFPNFTGATENISCSAWGCWSDTGWQKHWFGSIPRSAGEVSMTSAGGRAFTFKKNWWYYLLYPENAIVFRKQVPN